MSVLARCPDKQNWCRNYGASGNLWHLFGRSHSGLVGSLNSLSLGALSYRWHQLLFVFRYTGYMPHNPDTCPITRTSNRASLRLAAVVDVMHIGARYFLT
jgi:hypothetical protein